MAGINLNEHQRQLVVKIDGLVAKLKQWEDHDQRDVARWREELAEAAHELHVELMATGNEPRHHRYMLRNRGVPPTDPAFYRHIHPAEDLLAFINNVHANDDPEDQTVGAEFDFRVYSRRWGHHDTYRIRRTSDGWWVGYMAISGCCNERAEPYLYENLQHDGIHYPADLPDYFAWLWQQAEEQGLSRGELQREIDRLARWVVVEHGAVTFLDVLGWKGIWTRQDDAIAKLKALIAAARGRVATAIELGAQHIDDLRGFICASVDSGLASKRWLRSSYRSAHSMTRRRML